MEHEGSDDGGGCPMNEQEMLAIVSELRHMDEQTARLYDAVLQKVHDGQTADQLRRFREDHARHARELTAALTKRYEVPEQPTDEFRKYMEEQIHLVEHSGGEDEVMQRLLLAEESAAAEYAAAEQVAFDQPLSKLVQDFHGDEVRHVAWVEQHTPELARVGAGQGGAAPGPDIACIAGGFTDDRNPDDFE